MPNTFFTSDFHFWHANIIKYCNRPFKSVEEMNEELIRRYNSVVSPDDTVYVLGDFAMAFRPVETITPRLNGKKYLVPGNHDWCFPTHKKSKNSPKAHAMWLEKYVECGFSGVLSLAWRLPSGLLLSHLPYKLSGDEHTAEYEERFTDYRLEDKGDFLLHGHSHGKWRKKGRLIDVGVDAWNFTPVSLAQIEELIAQGPDTAVVPLPMTSTIEQKEETK